MGTKTKASGGKKSLTVEERKTRKAQMLNMVLNTTLSYAEIGAKFGVCGGTVFYTVGGRENALAAEAARKRRVQTKATHGRRENSRKRKAA